MAMIYVTYIGDRCLINTSHVISVTPSDDGVLVKLVDGTVRHLKGNPETLMRNIEQAHNDKDPL